MADVEFDGFDGNSGTSNSIAGRSARWIGMAGAATSIALVIGLGYWGYRLAVRDVNGIPVVRALDGPMRIAPDDPGGVIASNQGLSVNTVAADGGISPPGDRLLLAPPPVDLVEDDAIGTAVAMVAPVSGRSTESIGLSLAPMPEGEESALQNVSLNLTGQVNTDDINALVDSLAEGATPLSSDTDIKIETPPATVISLPKGALAESPRPRARPATVVKASLPAETATETAPEIATESNNAEITGDSLPSGTRLVQLGAYDSEDVARTEWAKLASKFGDRLASKTRIVQAAQSAGRTFYRLRAMGFDDEASARRFCTALVTEGAACIPVVVR